MLNEIFENWAFIIGQDTFYNLFTGFVIFIFLFMFIDFWKQ